MRRRACSSLRVPATLPARSPRRRPVGHHRAAVQNVPAARGRAGERIRVLQVADRELDAEPLEQRGVAARPHQAPHLPALRDQPLREMAADEAARAGDQAHVAARASTGVAADRRRLAAGGGRAPRARLAAQRRCGDVAHHRPVLAGAVHSASTSSSAVEERLRLASDSVSGGSSLITSFLPAAIVITPWSRCSGITTSCGNSPSLARWMRRQLSRAGGSSARRARSRSSGPRRGPP